MQPGVDAYFPVDDKKACGRRAKKTKHECKKCICRASRTCFTIQIKAARRVGHVTAATLPNNNSETTTATAPDAGNNSRIVKPKTSRINWANDPRMAQTVDEWDNCRPKNNKGKPMSMNQCGSSKGVPISTIK